MLSTYPDAVEVEKVRYLMLKATYEFAKKSIYNKKKERFEDAVVLYNKFVKRHPNSQYMSEVLDFHINIIEELKKLKV